MIDQRLITAYTSLGYFIFPFEAFDSTGRLIVPNAVQIPDEWKPDLVAAQEAPIWNAVFRRLSVLNDPGWGVYSLGVSFVRAGIVLWPTKSISNVAGTAQAATWTDSLRDVLLTSVQQVSGQAYVVQPRWISSLTNILNFVKSLLGLTAVVEQVNNVEHQPAGSSANDVVVRPYNQDEAVYLHAGESAPYGMEQVEALPVPGAAALSIGIQFLLGVIQAAAALTRGQNCLATTLWFAPQGHPGWTPQTAAEWSPAFDHQRSGAHTRAVSALWSPSPRPWLITFPNDPWQVGWPGTSLPHTPNQIALALNPGGTLAVDQAGGSAIAQE